MRELETLVQASGEGGFPGLEYVGSGQSAVVLRCEDIKAADTGGTVRVYFDSTNVEVVLGRRFNPLGGLLLLRPGVCYKVKSNLRIVGKIPDGITGVVSTMPEISDVLQVLPGFITEGDTGDIYFYVIPFRRVEIDRFITLARLDFFSKKDFSGAGNTIYPDIGRAEMSTAPYPNMVFPETEVTENPERPEIKPSPKKRGRPKKVKGE